MMPDNQLDSTRLPTRKFDQLINELRSNQKELVLPISQPPGSYFPEFLEERLEAYVAFCDRTLLRQLQAVGIIANGHGAGVMPHLLDDVRALVDGLIQAVKCHYSGSLREANESFDAALSKIDFIRRTSVETIPATAQVFYRARQSAGRRFTRKDIFHNPFENRHLVATSRYSIPGLPALYLGSSVYVCWEEFSQHPFKDLYFSRYEAQRDLRVVKIERLFQFLARLAVNWKSNERSMDLLTRYILLFPLFIACSIKTQHPVGNFKPEYIVPQLLLQYVTKHKEVDGIMFPSTKVNYDNLHLVPAYNYVFPVRTTYNKSGFCPDLEATFYLTEPTSTELEALLNHSASYPLKSDGWAEMKQTITLVEGVKSEYPITSFGTMERILRGRDVAPVKGS
ncbi:RES domain-containing protein [Hymenobacter convexus]|uniref:RES domain-containing protein n=1 Tax=Hymenobacter sp. CA1UV-4 TaxID=3063782 RepID=UPI002712F1AA|nr:RES domain-containing protein [Hymenobacter sp. CA1UV-4]MDO7851595.1 RES domain-containing protein [Hymenobacter sp. CA1UV-4]